MNHFGFLGANEGEEVWKTDGSIGPTVDERRTVVHYTVSPLTKFNITHHNINLSK